MPVQRGLAQECRQHFQTANLYEIFSLQRTATEAQGTIELILFTNHSETSSSLEMINGGVL